jgi:hypothetical protein
MQELMPTQLWQAQNAIVRSVRPDTLRRHLEKVAAALSVVLVRCRFGDARGRLWRKAAHRRRRMIQGCLGWLEAFYREGTSAVIDTSIPGRAV